MRTLLADRYAPITSSLGFIQAEFDSCVRTVVDWRKELFDFATADEIVEEFPNCLRSLEPLTGGVRPREMLIETSSDWVAYFDCFINGTDAVSTVGFLSEEMRCYGLALTAQPHTVGSGLELPGRYGAVQFELFGPVTTEFLNSVRSISVTHDGRRWEWTEGGVLQEFEDGTGYRARHVLDRFDSVKLEGYCRALGVDVFDPDFYGGRRVLIESLQEPPEDAEVMSLDDAQRRLGIVPGIADRLPG